MNNNTQKESLLPPPELLERYELIQKGLSKEFLDLVKKEQEHRHRMQNKYLFHFRIGQIFGASFLLYVIYGIFNLIKEGKLIPAYCTLGIFAIIILFILIQYRKDKLNAIIKNSKRFNNKFHNNTYRSNYHHSFNKR